LLLIGLIQVEPASAQGDPEAVGPPAPPKIIPKCRNSADEIVVCGSGGRSPYRLPQAPPGFDPEAGEDSISRERNALVEEGDSGIGSCSTVGPAGGSGCMARASRRSREQHGGHGRKKGLVAKVRGRDDPDPVPQP
jgi:hypothetical protein